MPVGWEAKTDIKKRQLAEELAKLDAVNTKRQWLNQSVVGELVDVTQPMFSPVPELVNWAPGLSGMGIQVENWRDSFPISADYQPLPNMGNIIPETGINIPTMGNQQRLPVSADYQPPQLPTALEQRQPPAPILVKEAPVSIPFWQRALQVFAAPFNWVDETIIKPGLALGGIATGIVSETPRMPGEDFWEWKKRSWAGWESPGIDVNVPWRDKPWRIDVKGVLELAPWLLIPGAGQVGGAAGIGARLAGKVGERAARGMAGFVGKAGLPGRIVGTAVEYSPWGFAEKTAGVAIKGGFRAVGAVSARVSTAVGEKLYGKYVPPPVLPEVAKLTRYMKEVVVPAREAFEKRLPKELRAKQEAAVRTAQKEYLAGNITLEELHIAQSTALKEAGALRPQFALTKEALVARKAEEIAVIENRIANGELTEAGGKALITKIERSPAFEVVPFERAEIDALNRSILEAAESGLLGKDSSDALFRLLMGAADNLPEPRFIKEEWPKVFGVEFAKAVGQFKTPQQLNQFVDALNLPRAMLASFDLSATLRQGLFLGLLHPTKVPVWFGRQVKALFSEKLAFQMDDALRARPLFKQFVADGGYIAPLREALPTKAEELFMSDIARRIPGVRRSERAFITYLNEARMAAYEAAHGAMTAQGAGQAERKMLTEFINAASGRGSIPQNLEKYMPALNTVLFSPRLQLATLQLPRQIGRMLLSDNPYMRKEAAKALVTFVGGGAALLGILKATGNKVELDPRSGDFAKIQIGETRLDIWRGYVQYARFAAQMLTGERKSAYGNMNKAERGEIAGRFLQSKSSPAFGLMVDLSRGETYLGKPIFKDTTGFSRVAMERVLPLALQDVIDAMEQGGINQVWVAAPAFLGIGALTYVNDFVRVKEKIAKELGFESWDDIDPKRQRGIENSNTELQAATIAFDRQVMGTVWGDWRLAGKAIEDVFRQNVENAVNKYRQDGLGVDFREKVSDAWTERRGAYKTREFEPRFEDIVKRMKVQDTLESLVGLGPEGVAIKIYQDALFGDDMFDEFGDYRFDEANQRKEFLRQQLGDEMFDYVEEYQGVRYQDLPQEFQDLQEAKKLMKPYWAVRDTVARLFGQRYAESNAGQSLISKRRKQLRLTNPSINRAYEMFYASK